MIRKPPTSPGSSAHTRRTTAAIEEALGRDATLILPPALGTRKLTVRLPCIDQDKGNRCTERPTFCLILPSWRRQTDPEVPAARISSRGEAEELARLMLRFTTSADTV